jgi:exopolyphosphatase/guanosine-5'-triphosphate,3'-diphosphate pyrophosphatase
MSQLSGPPTSDLQPVPELEKLALEERDPRLTEVLQLARTCQYEPVHTHHVTGLALRIFDDLSKLHGLGADARFVLQAAALLHDIGWVEGWENHHKTTLRIILEAQVLPFDSKERLLIGSIARYHRKALPKMKHDHYAALTWKEQRWVNILGGILRLADGLDRTHQVRVRAVRAEFNPKQIILQCTVRHPAEDERAGAMEKGDLLEQALSRKLVLVWGVP